VAEDNQNANTIIDNMVREPEVAHNVAGSQGRAKMLNLVPTQVALLAIEVGKF
jgi:hypothetical protein